MSDIRDLWQKQPAEQMQLAVAEVQRKASQFQNRIAWRNLREYLAAAVVIAVFSGYAIFLKGALVKAGAVLIVAASAYVAMQLFRRGSSTSVPKDLAMSSGIDFHKRQLERQRDLLRSVWSWYLLPPLPGIVLFYAGLAQQMTDRLPLIGLSTAHLALYAVVWWMNWRAAKRLQREIDQLDALSEETKPSME